MFYSISIELIGIGASQWTYDICSILLLISFTILLLMPFQVLYKYLQFRKK